jgi:hypothetical protein
MRALLSILFVVFALACGKPAEPAASPASEPAPAAPASPHADPHKMLGAEQAPATAAPTGPASAGGLTWEHAAPLVRRAPKSSMRIAEYGIEGDALSELTVFYFGPDQGGSVDANITRWLGQLQQADGSDTAAKAKRTTRELSGIAITQVEATGNFGGGMAMPGAPAPAAITDAMLLGAIAVGPQGPVFFKLTGPAQSVERARASFDQMLGSLRK